MVMECISEARKKSPLIEVIDERGIGVFRAEKNSKLQ